jgi:hypothetical protein
VLIVFLRRPLESTGWAVGLQSTACHLQKFFTDNAVGRVAAISGIFLSRPTIRQSENNAQCIHNFLFLCSHQGRLVHNGCIPKFFKKIKLYTLIKFQIFSFIFIKISGRAAALMVKPPVVLAHFMDQCLVTVSIPQRASNMTVYTRVASSNTTSQTRQSSVID